MLFRKTVTLLHFDLILIDELHNEVKNKDLDDIIIL